MTKEELLKQIEDIEKEGIDEEVGPNFFKAGAITEEDWKELTLQEKFRWVERTEVYEWQDYYTGFYSAMEIIKRLIN